MVHSAWQSLYNTSYPTHHRSPIIARAKYVVSTVTSIRKVRQYLRGDVLWLMQVKQPNKMLP